MLPTPLHPAVVHFPLVFGVVLPFVVLAALLAIRRGARPLRAWALPLAISMALTASAWVALETGEAEEDRVEAYVGEAAIHEHEEAAERFLLLAGVVTLVAGLGLASGTVGAAARIVATVGAIAVLVAGIQVGAAGGRLVYEHGAAEAYTSPASGLAHPAMEWEGDDH